MGMFDSDVQELQSKELTVADYIHSPIHILVGNPTYSVDVFTAIAKSMNLTGIEFLAKMGETNLKPVEIFYTAHIIKCSVCDWSNTGTNAADSLMKAEMHGMQEHPCNFVVRIGRL